MRWRRARKLPPPRYRLQLLTCSANWWRPAWSNFALKPRREGESQRLNAHCEEVYEPIALLNAILNLYVRKAQEAEHRFAMGEAV